MSSAIETAIAYHFSDKALLRQAMTHRSHSTPHNERLEFLGDGVLNFIIAHQLYQAYPDIDEGNLSRMRAHLVKEPTLASIASEISLGQHLRLGEGEVKTGGRTRPAALADALEALIGAVFVDSGYPAAEGVVMHLFAASFDNLQQNAVIRDAKSRLQEYLQGKKLALPNYRIIKTEGVAHQQTFFVRCEIDALGLHAEAEGTSRRTAEQAAAERILADLAQETS